MAEYDNQGTVPAAWFEDPTGPSPLTRHTQLEEELESIRRQLAEAGE